MKKLYIEIADTMLKRAYGLMDRKALAENHGMLFKFPYAHNLRFWMKDTYIPLDIAFLDEQGKIFQIEKMYPLSTRAITANQPCKYALEVSSGWFKENAVDVGMAIAGEALTCRRKVQAQVVKKEETKKKESHLFDKDKKEDEKVEEVEDVETPPEMEVEGEYPQSVYTVPYEEPEGQEGQPAPENPVQVLRDIRGKIKFADEHNLNMEIIYWTKRGHMLPPRKVQKLEDKGYVIKTGPSGELLVAFDVSPTIQGQGWSIKGMQPKSFILDNIVDLQLLDEAGKQLTDEQISQVKMQENPAKEQFEQTLKQQPNQPPKQQPPIYQQMPEEKQEQNKPRNWFDKLRNIFKR